MSLRLEIDGRAVIEFEDDTVTLGTDPINTVPLPPCEGLAEKHAVIRKVAGRWMVEVREAEGIRIADSPPTRMHWLSKGDVIRLTENGPEICFEPDRPATRFVAASHSKDTDSPPARPVLRPLDSEDPSDKEATLLLSKPRTIEVPSLDEPIELEEVDAPPRRPMNRPPSSPEIPSPKPTQIRPSTTRPVPPEPPARLPPVIKSRGWLEEGPSSSFQARQQRARTRFRLQGAGVGVLVVVALLAWRLGAGPSPNPIEVASAPQSSPPVTTVENSTPATVATMTPQATAGQQSFGPSRPAVAPDRQTNSPSRPATGLPATVIPATGLPASSNPAKTTASTDAEKPEHLPRNSQPSAPSALLTAVSEGIYVVFARRPGADEYFRLGTAWAVSRKALVTSGAIAIAAEDLQKEGLTIIVSQPGLDSPLEIKKARPNPAYRHAVERAIIARQQIAAESPPPSKDESLTTPEQDLTRALFDQARFDLGVLDLQPGQRLSNPLKTQTGELEDVDSQDFDLVGFPFSSDEYRSQSGTISEQPQERPYPRDATASINKNLMLTMTFTADVADNNWSGCPVFDRAKRVIGVYSRPVKSIKASKNGPGQEHSVVWLGRLVEFASDLE